MNILFRKAFFSILNQIKIGTLCVQEKNKKTMIGHVAHEYPLVHIYVNNPRFYRLLMLQGTLGAGKSYIQGDWNCDNLPMLFRLLFVNSKLYTQIDHGIVKIYHFIKKIKYGLSKNNISRAKKHIHQHYDLGNDFFKLFLDNRMMYSCAIFDDNHKDLDSASEHKLKVICDKLQLSSQDHLLEIGSGWGGFAIFAHENYGCKVTTTTISEQQFAYVTNYVASKKLQSKITVLKQDYRELTGKFDKIVSIEMIEAVGFEYISAYFKKIDALLKPKGLFLLQAITINDSDYERAKYEVDFMKEYIFPGGSLPSLGVITKIIQEKTQLECINFADITESYVKTLKFWQERFIENKDKIIKMGFDQAFYRKWLYYFIYCQSGFEHHHTNDIQMLMLKNEGR